MGNASTLHVGLDVHKESIAVAYAPAVPRAEGLQSVAGGNTPWRRLGRPGPLVWFHWFNSPGRPRCRAIAADPSTTCRPDTQPLHSASPRRSQYVAPVCSIGTLAAHAPGWRLAGSAAVRAKEPRQMNWPSSAWRQHV
jgi:hypothetical protein